MYVIMGHSLRIKEPKLLLPKMKWITNYNFSFERTVSIFIKNIIHILPILRITILV